MTRYLMLLKYNCLDTKKEAEFNEWYENMHIPDVLTQSDFKKATRWEAIDCPENEGKYVTAYEIETDNLAKTMDIERDNIARLKARNRLSDQFVLVSRCIYKLISSASK
jgi:hypothetical protein